MTPCPTCGGEFREDFAALHVQGCTVTVPGRYAAMTDRIGTRALRDALNAALLQAYELDEAQRIGVDHDNDHAKRSARRLVTELRRVNEESGKVVERLKRLLAEGVTR